MPLHFALALHPSTGLLRFATGWFVDDTELHPDGCYPHPMRMAAALLLTRPEVRQPAFAVFVD
jgi:hypothetical protein